MKQKPDPKKTEEAPKATATQLLVAYVRTLPVGGVLTAAKAMALTNTVSIPYSTIASARRILLRDYSIVVGCTRTVGWVRLNDLATSRDADTDLLRVNRISVRSVAKLDTVDTAKLPASEQMPHKARRTIMGLSAAATSSKVRNAVATLDANRDVPAKLESMVRTLTRIGGTAQG